MPIDDQEEPIDEDGKSRHGNDTDAGVIFEPSEVK